MRVRVGLFLFLAFLCSAAAVSAQETPAEVEYDARHQGLSYSFPAYLYGPMSASGAQLGFQTGALNFRLDASIVSGTEEGQMTLFANPSLGAFLTEDWESKIRTYQGLAIGVQKGIWNSFEGMSYFLNFVTGAEWFVFERKAVFLEIGSGMALFADKDAYEGGTVIGGGIKCFF